MSGWFDSFNAAVGLTNDPATVQKDLGNEQLNLQDRMFNYQKELYRADLERNNPYYGSGAIANAYLQSMMTGQTANYADPRYSRLTSDELARLNVNNATPYDANKTWYRGPNGEIVNAPPTLSADFALGSLSPAGQYQLNQGSKALNRALASRGLSGSGQAAVALGDLNQNVAGQDYSNKYSRLLDMVKIGTGASAAAGGASQYASSAAGNNAALGSQTLGNLGNMRASLYSGQQAQGYNLANLGMSLYDRYMNNQNSGTGGFAANDNSYPDFGGGNDYTADWSNDYSEFASDKL